MSFHKFKSYWISRPEGLHHLIIFWQKFPPTFKAEKLGFFGKGISAANWNYNFLDIYFTILLYIDLCNVFANCELTFWFLTFDFNDSFVAIIRVH